MELLVQLVVSQILRITCYLITITFISVFVNIVLQQVFYRRNEPPVVFHWFPIVGSTVRYGMDPYRFFLECREKYGEIFTFILLGKKVTVYLGIEGNEFILNGKLKDVNAEEVYGKLTTPVFGSDVRDVAHVRMREIYLDIINERRQQAATGTDQGPQAKDMIWHLMDCVYRDGTPIPDKEIAHMMITLLMAGQHSSSAISCWILLRLASEPEMTEKLYAEQINALGSSGSGSLPPLTYRDLEKLPLLAYTTKETLRIHSSIHTLMRKVKNPLPVPGTNYVVPTTHTLLSSPGVTARDDRYFRNAMTWDPHRWESRVEEQVDETDTVDYGYGAVSKGTRSPYLPFGAGRHRCIGEKFAYMNLAVIVATLVREFRFYNPEDRVGVPETDYSSLFSRPVQPATVRWERRHE
ncbi:hypothetical protein N7486_006447 [Penicillium sp. IBT 16267x]|nr:hypothetical protein N7486_006447 [Penicillium sp. IBT 16267x]